MTRPTRKTIGKYDRRSARIGFYEWNLDAIEDGAVKILNKAFKEALDIATSEYKVTAEFTHNTKRDIATIQVGLPIGPEEYENPIWDFNLAELVENEIFDAEDVDGLAAPRLTLLRDRLRELADKLDDAISSPDKPAA